MFKTFWHSRKLKWSLLSLGIILAAAVSYYTYSLFHFAHEIQSSEEKSRFKQFASSDAADDASPPKWEGKDRVNILLLGGDSRGLRENEIPRSDSIMVVSLDPVTKQAFLFSILRDTYAEIPGHGSQRINAAITLGGPKLAMETVGELLGVPIQYFVYTDFKGFIELIDAIGGIEFEVEKNMKYSDSADDHVYDIDLKKGLQHLDGNTALQYVRFRHDALSDFARTERQRKFLQALAVKLQSTSSLIKVPKILNRIDPYIETNMSIMEMIKLASLAYDCKADGLISHQLPPLNLLVEDNIGGAAVITVNKQRLQHFIQSEFEKAGEVSLESADTSMQTGTDAEHAVE